MKQEKKINGIPGTTLEEEKEMFQTILAIADENVNRARRSVDNLADELHELKEIYDAEDKEGLALWFNTDARFQHVRQELLRMERSRKKPYFGRIDFTDPNLSKQECYYIGKAAITRDAADLVVIDWRAPIASVYYESSIGRCTYQVKGEEAIQIDLSRKRTYEIEEDELKDFYDSDVVANDDLLTKYLAKHKTAVLHDIIATIQQEQNQIIRKKPHHNVIVQGGAGSGKTTVAMHRISYILYNYDLEFKPQDFYIIGSNQILLNYITGILPDLDVYGISQMTMEQLFIRLLYEDWDRGKHQVKKLEHQDKAACVKGSYAWFHDLQTFCRQYEWDYIPRGDVRIEATDRLLMEQGTIEKLLNQFGDLSLPQKLDKLTEHLLARLENEIYGRYYTYPPQEQKRLLKYYQTYFGRREWRGSIFELYDDFLRQQQEKGHRIPLPGMTFDLYDLAALAYLYKRIKEQEVIQEASHVVIDEAQDFGMMAYGALRYCLSKCTFTIMGDVSQNIYFDYGLTDWEELRGLMLPGAFDYFGLLRKSYRNTVEIAHFALEILQHGNFPIYPVEPIIRHGNQVSVQACSNQAHMVSQAAEIIGSWQQNGYETIAVICRDEKQVDTLCPQLERLVALRTFSANTEQFGRGVMVLPLEYAKGLEFDAVLLYQVDQSNYPLKDGYAKLLYVAATRALHELAVIYTGSLTDLIATPVSEEKKQKYLVIPEETSTKSTFQRPEKTNQELLEERVSQGKFELEFRDKIGPGKIVAQKPKSQTEIASSPPPKAGPDSKDFGNMPTTNLLRPPGRSNLNQSILWVNKQKTYVELTSAGGVLRLTPVSDQVIGISFAKETIKSLGQLPDEVGAAGVPALNYREARDRVDLLLENMVVQVSKKTGAVAFYTKEGKLLLSEATPLSRQLASGQINQTWTFFNWGKQEQLKAIGKFDSQILELKSTAKYISCGLQSKRAARLVSGLGYQLVVPSGRTVMCCTIPVHGTYLYTEGQCQIDYFFCYSGK